MNKISEQLKGEIRELTRQAWKVCNADKWLFKGEKLSAESEKDWQALDRVCKMLNISYEATGPTATIQRNYGGAVV